MPEGMRLFLFSQAGQTGSKKIESKGVSRKAAKENHEPQGLKHEQYFAFLWELGEKIFAVIKNFILTG
jgi:hypothetical protein